MRELYTEIDINATPECVWNVLVDIEMWKDWNPFIPKITGEISVGSRLRVRVEPPQGRAMTFTSTVSCVHENREFAWAGSAPIPGAFHGEHIFELRSADTGDFGKESTRLIHREEFSGWMLPFLWKRLDTRTRAGFELMNQALKAESERAN